jgi:hypothetical protein
MLPPENWVAKKETGWLDSRGGGRMLLVGFDLNRGAA